MSTRVKRCQLYAGLELIGSSLTMSENRTTKLEATSIGIRMESSKTNRVIVIPYSNIKGLELYPEVTTDSIVPVPVVATTQVSEAPKRRRGRQPKAE